MGIRWTIGNASPAGRFALGLSILGAYKIFGQDASYAVTVNSISTDEIRSFLEPLPVDVAWISSATIPEEFIRHCSADLAEGVAWKFSPVRVFKDVYELSLDNDCILWECPSSVDRWLKTTDSFLLAADVITAFGKFNRLLGDRRLNSGIRGLPPGFDFAAELLRLMDENQILLESELDEQGLQVAAALRSGPCEIVPVEQVSICSPFPPHQPGLGASGAHFVGINARSLSWKYYDRPAAEVRLEHFLKHLPEVAARVGY